MNWPGIKILAVGQNACPRLTPRPASAGPRWSPAGKVQTVKEVFAYACF